MGDGGWSILVDRFNGVTSDMPVSGTGIASSVGVVRLYKNGITNSIEQDPITTDTVGSYLAEFKLSDASLSEWPSDPNEGRVFQSGAEGSQASYFFSFY